MLWRNKNINKQLLVGCTNKFKLAWCGYSHSSPDFSTLDINPDNQPDIVADIFDADALATKLGDAKFSSIIFEHVPLNSDQFINAKHKLTNQT